MTQFIITYLSPIMFGSLIFFLLLGFPVAFTLSAVGIIFGYIGIAFGLFTPNFLQALPSASSASCRTRRCSRSRSSPSWA